MLGEYEVFVVVEFGSDYDFEVSECFIFDVDFVVVVVLNGVYVFILINVGCLVLW